MPTEFMDDAERYSEWLRDTAHGYVANLLPPPAKSYFVIHHASCHSITGNDHSPDEAAQFTERGYRKLIADDPDDLVRWAVSRGIPLSVPRMCGHCCPGEGVTADPAVLFGQTLVLVQSERTAGGAHDHWDDEEGYRYQYPNNYVNRVRPGRWFVYYRGTRRNSGRGEPEYFGVGRVGSISRDPAIDIEAPRREWRWYCTIEDYHPLATPIPWKRSGGTHYESIPPNHWGVAVRELAASDFIEILSGPTVVKPRRRLSAITDRAAVLAATSEYDTLGSTRFLEQYGYRASKKYVLSHEGRTYDSKAIVGVAFGYQFPDEGFLKSSEFSGGQPVRSVLDRLGFELEQLGAVPAQGPAPRPTRDSAIRVDLSAAQREWEAGLGAVRGVSESTYDLSLVLAALDALSGRTHIKTLADAMKQNAAAMARQLTVVQRELGKDALQWDRAAGFVAADIDSLRTAFGIESPAATIETVVTETVEPTVEPPIAKKKPSTGKDWTAEENRACVSAYFELLDAELAGRRMVKSKVNADLRAGWLKARSKGSVEFKMCNVSAVMDELGCRWVTGYRPAGNFQADLGDEVSRQLDQRGWKKYES